MSARSALSWWWERPLEEINTPIDPNIQMSHTWQVCAVIILAVGYCLAAYIFFKFKLWDIRWMWTGEIHDD